MGLQDEAPLNHIHVQYTDMVNWVMSNYSAEWSIDHVEEMMSYIRKFKKYVCRLFGPHCEQGRHILELHLFEHLAYS